MKRSLLTLGVSAAFLAVTSVVGYFASYIPLGFWELFAVATSVLVAGAVLAISLRDKASVKVVTLIINAVSMGMFIRCWYINRNYDNPLWLMLSVSLLAALYLAVFMLPLIIPIVRRHCAIYLLVFIILSIAGYVCLIVFTKTTWVSTLGYFGILQLGFCIALLYNGGDSNMLRSFQLASYSVALCAIIIAVIALGGDGLDGLGDCFSAPSNSGKARNKDKTLSSLPMEDYDEELPSPPNEN